MNRKQRRQAKIQCSRCGERTRPVKAVGWNATFSAGRVVGYLCPACQTPEENVEAEINLATTNYGLDPFGRVIGFPKIGAES